MTKTHTTATAAHAAQVSTATIRSWCRNGVVSATKTAGQWVITAESLTARIAIGQDIEVARNARKADAIADRADLTPYKDKVKARQNVIELVGTGSVIRLTDTVAQVLSKTDHTLCYTVDLAAQTCDCKGHGRHGYCAHRTTVNALAA